MEFKIYHALPPEAAAIRTRVFMEEQGFRHEFDAADNTAMHIVAFINRQPAGTCRFFADKEPGCWIFGRLAVLPEYRSQHLGAALLKRAEEEIVQRGGHRLSLHAQVRVQPFYIKQGYAPCGTADAVDFCPHIWMAKTL